MFIITFIRLLNIYKTYINDIHNMIANYKLLDTNTFNINMDRIDKYRIIYKSNEDFINYYDKWYKMYYF